MLYHLTPQLMTLLEFDGAHVFGGEEDGVNVVNVTPGFKVQPLDDPNLQVEIGVSLPLTDDKEFCARPMWSMSHQSDTRLSLNKRLLLSNSISSMARSSLRARLLSSSLPIPVFFFTVGSL